MTRANSVSGSAIQISCMKTNIAPRRCVSVRWGNLVQAMVHPKRTIARPRRLHAAKAAKMIKAVRGWSKATRLHSFWVYQSFTGARSKSARSDASIRSRACRQARSGHCGQGKVIFRRPPCKTTPRGSHSTRSTSAQFRRRGRPNCGTCVIPSASTAHDPGWIAKGTKLNARQRAGKYQSRPTWPSAPGRAASISNHFSKATAKPRIPNAFRPRNQQVRNRTRHHERGVMMIRASHSRGFTFAVQEGSPIAPAEETRIGVRRPGISQALCQRLSPGAIGIGGWRRPMPSAAGLAGVFADDQGTEVG
jgi:hypothetical protein